MFQQGTRDCSQAAAGEKDLISHCNGNIVVFLKCSGKLGFLLQLCQGPQGASHIALGKSRLLSSCEGSVGLLSSHCKEIGPHLALRWESCCVFLCCIMKLWVSLEFQGGPQGTSHVASGKSDLLSSFKGNLEIPLEWLLGNGV